MSIKEKAKELVAGAMLMTAVATTGCGERAYDGIDGPDHCVWSDWNNPHCGECKEEVCENYNGKAVCYEVPCGSRNEGNSESEQEALEEMRRARESYERGLEDEREVVNRQLREVKPVKKSVEQEITRPSPSGDPKGFCDKVILGSEYKNGVCHQRIVGRIKNQKHLERRLPYECEVKNVKVGKAQKASATADCEGIPLKIVMEKFQNVK